MREVNERGIRATPLNKQTDRIAIEPPYLPIQTFCGATIVIREAKIAF